MSKQYLDNSYLYGTNALFIEDLYEKYKENPASVDKEWQIFFAENDASRYVPSWYKKHALKPTAKNKPAVASENTASDSGIDRVRRFGHLAAKLDPLGLDIPQNLHSLSITENASKLDIYTSSIGVEFSHISSNEEQEFLYHRFEEIFLHKFSKEQKIDMLQDLVEVEGLEQYLHKKFPGAKRFSVEGGESSIISLCKVIEEAGKYGVEEVVIGMAHRGRLNSLTKVLGKPYEALLAEFQGQSAFPKELGIAGDVKYHMGFSNDIVTDAGNKLHLTLTPNPSHLEAVNPVVAGRVRAKQDLIGDKDRSKVLGLLFHGDAAFCGQGVVAECLMMSTIQAYDTGGIFHVVINNQVGFTAGPKDGHPSSRYSTEFAKIIGAPIIHVNGDDIEAVVKSTILASEYRAKFKKDVVVEILCYRKYGHNEGDEPMYTQPLMYNIIKNKKTPASLYSSNLVCEGVIKEGEYDSMSENFKAKLDKAYELSKSYEPKAYFLEGIWEGFAKNKTDQDKNLATGIELKKLEQTLSNLCLFPSSFNINPKLEKLFSQRISDFREKKSIDWATGEQLAFASVLQDGFPIRITGQDAARGTFSHRHSVLHDQANGEQYLPLNHLKDKQANYEVADSCLSEYGVLGYEFGYSMSNPKTLTIWEAQFGDFSNGAQIIFDQFISTTETKWLRLSGLVLLLPHGYEGQGPEHTSARMERLLQLCAEDNMQIAYPTTPASIFHILRRQQLRQVRKPLIIFSPKSMLRNPLATSKTSEIGEGTKFQRVIGDDLDHKSIKKLVICSGKIYYDLLDKRIKSNIKDVALIRIEQIYPFPVEALNKEIDKYKNAKIIWCQEEPENMGAWSYFHSRIAKLITNGNEIKLVSRKEAASPATGYASVHIKEQNELIENALRI